MKNIFIAVCASMMLICTAVHAEEIDTRDVVNQISTLTPKQQEEILGKIKQANASNQPQSKSDSDSVADKVVNTVTPEKLDKWANYGVAFGKALGSAAKELGVAVNEFAKTPVGIIATLTIVYSIIGQSLLTFISAFAFLIIAALVWLRVWNSITVNSIEYEQSQSPFGKLFGLSKLKSINRITRYEAEHFFAFIAAIAILIIFGVMI